MKAIGRVFLLLMIGIIVAALGLAAFTKPASAEKAVKPLVLRYTSGNAPVGRLYNIEKAWGAEIKEKTKGRITIQFMHGGSLAKIGETLEAVQTGLADFGGLPAIFYPSRLPLSAFTYAVPFNPPDIRLLNKILDIMDEQMPEIRAELEKENVKPLWRYPIADYNLQTVNPSPTLADLKGLKIAAVGATLPKWLASVGAVPVALGVPDRYSALQTGLIGGTIMSLSIVEPLNYTDFCKYVTLINLGSAESCYVIVNIDVWNKLSSNDQQIIMEASLTAQKTFEEITMQDEESLIPRWKRNLGVTFYQLSDADKAAWAELLKYQPYEWAAGWDAKGVPASKVIDNYFKVCEKVGYKFPVKYVKK
jgi:TRAP-type C4-dicarboxylate transport system substrate-binding protein